MAAPVLKVCALCGHRMTLARCGSAAVNDDNLCHAGDHDCYHAWTVYGIRPANIDRLPSTWLPEPVLESVAIARAKVASDELIRLLQGIGD